MHPRAYLDFLRYARKVTRRASEAEDLLQTVLVAAVEQGRLDLTRPDNRRWILGALRKRALFDARSAVRRRGRDAVMVMTQAPAPETETQPAHFLAALPSGLRTTALLVLSGHSRPEIAWLLRLSDAALRQRIAEIRRRWRQAGGETVGDFPGLAGRLPFGRIRRALLLPVRQGDAVLASHDPDGHLFVIGSQKARSRQQESVQAPQAE